MYNLGDENASFICYNERRSVGMSCHDFCFDFCCVYCRGAGN